MSTYTPPVKIPPNMEVLFFNIEDMFVYHTQGVLCFTDADKFNNLLIQEKKKIAEREYVLNRFEPWEVNDVRSLKMILSSRCRNQEEKTLVAKYVSYLTKE